MSSSKPRPASVYTSSKNRRTVEKLKSKTTDDLPSSRTLRVKELIGETLTTNGKVHPPERRVSDRDRRPSSRLHFGEPAPEKVDKKTPQGVSHSKISSIAINAITADTEKKISSRGKRIRSETRSKSTKEQLKIAVKTEIDGQESPVVNGMQRKKASRTSSRSSTLSSLSGNGSDQMTPISIIGSGGRAPEIKPEPMDTEPELPEVEIVDVKINKSKRKKTRRPTKRKVSEASSKSNSTLTSIGKSEDLTEAGPPNIGTVRESSQCSVPDSDLERKIKMPKLEPKPVHTNGIVKMELENNVQTVAKVRLGRHQRVPNVCECTKENPGMKPSPDSGEIGLCGAVECLGSTLSGCFWPANPGRDGGRMYRVSETTPFRELCSAHFNLQQTHMCCPFCGLFCSQGNDIMACKNDSSAQTISHLFHYSCARHHDATFGSSNSRSGCPHCGDRNHIQRITLHFLSSDPPLFLPDRNLSSRNGLAKIPSHSQPDQLEDEFFKSISAFSVHHMRNIFRGEGVDHNSVDELNLILSDELLLEAIEKVDIRRVYHHLAANGNFNLTYPTRNMKSPIHLAVETGNIILLHLICDKIDTNVDVWDAEGQTALMLAAKLNNSTMMKYLLAVPADPFIQDNQGLTVLHHAVQAGSEAAVQVVLEFERSLVGFQCESGLTPLMLAVKNNFPSITKTIIDKIEGEPGALVEIDIEENTTLHWAARAGYVYLIYCLLKYGVYIDPPNEAGETPLHLAVKSEQYVAAVTLVRYGADPFIKDKNGLLVADLLNLSTAEQNEIESDSPRNSVKEKMTLLFMLQLKKAMGRDTSQLGKVRFYKSDISKRNENIRISCINSVNDDKFPDFIYTVTNRSLQNYFGTSHDESTKHNCPCLPTNKSPTMGSQQTNETVYNREGRLFGNADGERVFNLRYVTECGSECPCDRLSCRNRTVQNGIKTLLQVFYTPIVHGKSKGWGLRTLLTILSGSFICEMTGEFISLGEILPEDRDSNYVIETFRSDVNENVGLAVDTKFKGNVARFVNHSCSPNAILVRVIIPGVSFSLFPRIALFARRSIMSHEEITINYGASYWEEKIKRENVFCLCQSPECLYSKKVLEKAVSLV